jgi:large subunit ribosomal protein L9
MKVILKKSVEALGQSGDVCTVSTGYARNFLFPKKLAMPATSSALAKVKKQAMARVHAAESELHATERTASGIDGYELVLSGKANESGTLFASISKKKIAVALAARGFQISPNHIVLREPIKEVGDHEVVMHFPHGLEARIRVVVERG